MSSSDETGLRLAVGAVRRVDERILRFAAQLGVRGVVVNTPLDLPGDERWELMTSRRSATASRRTASASRRSRTCLRPSTAT